MASIFWEGIKGIKFIEVKGKTITSEFSASVLDCQNDEIKKHEALTARGILSEHY